MVIEEDTHYETCDLYTHIHAYSDICMHMNAHTYTHIHEMAIRVA